MCTVWGEMRSDGMYEIPSDDTIGRCKITQDVVEGEGEPELIYRSVEVPRGKKARTAG